MDLFNLLPRLSMLLFVVVPLLPVRLVVGCVLLVLNRLHAGEGLAPTVHRLGLAATPWKNHKRPQ